MLFTNNAYIARYHHVNEINVVAIDNSNYTIFIFNITFLIYLNDLIL
jgi:hypothetical protein